MGARFFQGIVFPYELTRYEKDNGARANSEAVVNHAARSGTRTTNRGTFEPEWLIEDTSPSRWQSRVRTSDISYLGEWTRKGGRLQGSRCAFNNEWN